MQLLVTGASGFIGAHFVRHALAAGHEILAIHRSPTPPYEAAGLRWLRAELDDLPVDCMRGCEALIHFAAAGVTPKKASFHDLIYVNSLVPVTLLEEAAHAGVRRVVMAGSYAEYGRSAAQYDFIPPEAPLLPTDPYAASKAACFVAVHGAALHLSLELCYLRVFSAFGEGQFETNLWPALRKAALAGEDFKMTAGEQIRDFISVEDAVQEFLFATTRKDVTTQSPLVWNVASGRPTPVRDFAWHWWRHWKASGQLSLGAVPYRPNEMMRYVPLVSR